MAKRKNNKAQRKQERADLNRVIRRIRLERGLPEVPPRLTDADKQRRQAAEERKARYLEAFDQFPAEVKAAHLLTALDLLARLQRRKAAEAAQAAEDAEQAQIDQTAADLLSDVDLDV